MPFLRSNIVGGFPLTAVRQIRQIRQRRNQSFGVVFSGYICMAAGDERRQGAPEDRSPCDFYQHKVFKFDVQYETPDKKQE